jgi:hypothetical protein
LRESPLLARNLPYRNDRVQLRRFGSLGQSFLKPTQRHNPTPAPANPGLQTTTGGLQTANPAATKLLAGKGFWPLKLEVPD